jgi:hypothetical protein
MRRLMLTLTLAVSEGNATSSRCAAIPAGPEAYYKYRHNNSTAGMQELINKYKVTPSPDHGGGPLPNLIEMELTDESILLRPYVEADAGICMPRCANRFLKFHAGCLVS